VDFAAIILRALRPAALSNLVLDGGPLERQTRFLETTLFRIPNPLPISPGSPLPSSSPPRAEVV
jgi:hypothetical protein